MLNKILAFTLLLTVSVQCFHKAFVVLNFYWNQSYIAQVLCENKDKPKLKCAGKCQLMKQLEKEEKKEQQLPNLKWDGKEQVISSRSFFASAAGVRPISLHSYNTFDEKIISQFTPSVFHPPGHLI